MPIEIPGGEGKRPIKLHDKDYYNYCLDYDYKDKNGRGWPYRTHYRYYDSEEGADCLKKAWYCTKTGWGFGLGAGILTVWSKNWMHPPWTKKFGTYVKWSSVGAMAGAVFAVSACLLNQARKKDDQWNHVFASLAMSTVFVPAVKDVRLGIAFSIPFAIGWGTKHYYRQMGWGNPFFNREALHFANETKIQTIFDHDWTLRQAYQTEYGEEGRKKFKVDY